MTSSVISTNRRAKYSLRQFVRRQMVNSPRIKSALAAIERAADSARFMVGTAAPSLVPIRPRKITMAITALCNLRCQGCRYGRDFMPGSVLPFDIIDGVLEDASNAGIETIRLYGGEPLLHPDLCRIVAASRAYGLNPYMTTNGLLLGQQIDELYSAGLRDITIGFYGTDTNYDDYVQRPGRFHRLEESLEMVRRRIGGSMNLQLNFLLSRRSCSVEAVDAAWTFAERFDMKFHTDLVHYSLPYFTEGPNRCLQFGASDERAIYAVVERMLTLKATNPRRFPEPVQSLVSIPDWLLKGPSMRIPCDAEKLIWIGADGTVQLCYVTFMLGNLYQKRLGEMLFSAAHRRAARGAFGLECPNCHCERAERVVKHVPSRIRYRRLPIN